MKMANFLMPKGTSGSHVTNEDQVDPDVTAIGGIAVRRGPIGDIASAVAAVVSRDRAYISTSSANFDGVSVVDLDTKTVVATYPLAFSVAAMAISPDGKRVYAGRTGHDRVDIAVIDTTAERVGTVDIATGAGIGIDAIEVDPTGKRLYIATTDVLGSQLVIVDAETARV